MSAAEDDKTRLAGNLQPPSQSPATSVSTEPNAGAGGAGTAPNALGPGFDLREFEIERVIGEGGFSIVYLAIDRQLVRRIAIKEYMPSALALRTRDLTIVPKSERVRETFEAGLRSFVNEARLLAQFDHPSLVKVYRFWEERGTAYMVMPYYDGITLSHWRRQHGPAEEPWLRRLLYSLLDALAQLHGQNCYHRDIAPDNILLLPGDHPVLLDLGAARRIIGDMTQALTVILKPGYAPVEQYAEVASMKQGAWTDLYALSAVLYFVVAGRAPPPAVARMVNDEMRPAREIGAGRYSDEILAVIDAGLAVLPEKRPQSIDAFRQLLGPDTTQFANRAPAGKTAMHPTSSPGIPGVTTAAPTPVTAAPTTWVAEQRATAQEVTAHMYAPVDDAPLEPVRTPWRLVFSGLAVAMVVVALLVWTMQRSPAPPPVTEGKSGSAGVPPPPVQPKQSSSQEILLGLLDQRSASIEVRTASLATSMRIGEDKLKFGVATNIGGYVYVLMAGTDENDLFLLFPNKRDNNNAIAANTTMLLPRKDWEVTASGPPGVDRVLVIVSPRPRDFAGTGLREGKYFSEFSIPALREAIARGGPAIPAGRADCAGVANCDTSFGAAMFEVIEVEASEAKAGAAANPGSRK
jgi:serine/threonine protein kinase